MITAHKDITEKVTELSTVCIELPAIEDDPLVGLFAGTPDLAENSEEILAQEITDYSGWTWKTSMDEDDLDSLLLAHNPRFFQLLEDARQRVRVTGGLSLEEFRQKLAERYPSHAEEAVKFEP